MSAPRRRGESDLPGPDPLGSLRPDNGDLRETSGSLRAGEPENSAPAAEAEAAAGAEASRESFAHTLAAAVRERDRALDKATARLASVTAGGYLEYDRSVSVALAAFESAWHNARAAFAAASP